MADKNIPDGFQDIFLLSSYVEGQTQRFEYSVGEVHFQGS